MENREKGYKKEKTGRNGFQGYITAMEEMATCPPTSIHSFSHKNKLLIFDQNKISQLPL